jgi:hypothetical protein
LPDVRRLGGNLHRVTRDCESHRSSGERSTKGGGIDEETIYDPRNGKPVNNNFADYIVPVNADAPEMDCIFLDRIEPWRQITPTRSSTSMAREELAKLD